MKNTVFTLLLICCLSLGVKAQQPSAGDVVKLKSGAIYKGQISEYQPHDSLTIVLIDGRIKSFASAEIESISESGAEVVTLKKQGFFNETALGVRLNFQEVNDQGVLMLSTVNGMRFGRSSYGIGLGYESLLQDAYIPLYGSYQYAFSSSDLRPYVGAMLGYVFNADKDASYDYWWANPAYEGGFTTGLEAGVQHYFNSKVGISLGLGYRFYKLSSEPHYRYLTSETSYPVTGEAELHRFNLKLGFLFN